MDSTSTRFASPADALRALFNAWPSDRGEGTGFAEAYIIAVERYSLRAIEGAVMRLIRGEVDDVDRRFLPTPAQLSNLCAYMEKLYAPPARSQALPAPGSETRTEEEWARRAAQAAAARERFGIKPTTGETVVDRDTMPEALKAERDKAVIAAAAKLKGPMTLSDEALSIFRRDMAGRAVGSPDEQFDTWNKEAAE